MYAKHHKQSLSVGGHCKCEVVFVSFPFFLNHKICLSLVIMLPAPGKNLMFINGFSLH